MFSWLISWGPHGCGSPSQRKWGCQRERCRAIKARRNLGAGLRGLSEGYTHVLYVHCKEPEPDRKGLDGFNKDSHGEECPSSPWGPLSSRTLNASACSWSSDSRFVSEPRFEWNSRARSPWPVRACCAPVSPSQHGGSIYVMEMDKRYKVGLSFPGEPFVKHVPAPSRCFLIYKIGAVMPAR